MKTSRFLCVTLLTCIIVISFISCKHKAETVVVKTSPIIRQWKGTTWQNKPITISVAQVDTGLFITSYDFVVKDDSSSTNDSLHLSRRSDNGIAPVKKDSTFSVPIANVDANAEYVKGKFNLINMTIAGSLRVIFKVQGDTMTGNFTATKQK